VSRMAAVRARLESCAPDAKTFPLSSMEGHAEEEGKTDNLDRYNGDIYEQVKAQSIQLSSLADMVKSLQSQVKQLQETTKLRKHHKTTSVRKKSTSNFYLSELLLFSCEADVLLAICSVCLQGFPPKRKPGHEDKIYTSRIIPMNRKTGRASTVILAMAIVA